MNSVSTIDLIDKGHTPQAQVTGSWHRSHEQSSEKAFRLGHMVKIAGFAFSLAVSPVTAIPDPWLIERQRRDAVVTMSIYKGALGRFISRADALRIARQILEQAEQERLAIAEFEAARGIHWGDQP